MKLRNKKTGEIVDFKIHKFAKMNDEGNSLYEPFNGSIEEWEDYEEPKRVYFIDTQNGCVDYFELYADYICDVDFNSKIGNYFKTKVEAEKAVEKLKAWKRLKDNGFKFEGLGKRGRHIHFYQGKSYKTDKQCQQAMKDLDLLFGGE